MKKGIDWLFQVSLLLSTCILLLPPEYKVVGYSPNWLGWLLILVCLPTTFVLFVWGTIVDIRLRKWDRIIGRLALILIALVFNVILMINTNP
jgi:hypothetical protein